MPAGFNLAENETREGWNKSYAGRVFAGTVDGTADRATPTGPVQFNGFQAWGDSLGFPRGDDLGNYGFFNSPSGDNLSVVDSGVTQEYLLNDLYINQRESLDTIYGRIRRRDGNTIHAEDIERIMNSGFYIIIDNVHRDIQIKSELLVFSEAAITINNDGVNNHILITWFDKKKGKDMFRESYETESSRGGQIGIYKVINKKTHNITPLPTFTGDEIVFDEPQSVRIYWKVNLRHFPFLVTLGIHTTQVQLNKLPINKMSEYEFEVKYRESPTSEELTATQTDPPTVDSNGAEIILIGSAQVIQPVLKLKYQVSPTLCRSFYVRVEKDS